MNSVSEDKEKTYSIFDILKIIETVKTPWNELPDELKKKYSQFMLNRFVSSLPMFLEPVSQLDTLKLTDEQHYYFLCDIISPNMKHYFNYNAYKGKKEDEDTKLLIYACTNEYQIGKKDAMFYISHMTDDIKQKLVNKWKDMYKETK